MKAWTEASLENDFLRAGVLSSEMKARTEAPLENDLRSVNVVCSAMRARSEAAVELVQVPPVPADDGELVQRCQAGDHSAFREIYDRYHLDILRTLIVMTSNGHHAEDLTQVVFERAWKGIGGFRRGAPMRPWLLKIARNALNSHHRRRVFTFVRLEVIEGHNSQGPGPEALYEQEEGAACVRRALEKLPADVQRLLRLRYVAERSVPEIACLLRWREGTVKSRLHRAREQMREILQEDLSE